MCTVGMWGAKKHVSTGIQHEKCRTIHQNKLMAESGDWRLLASKQDVLILLFLDIYGARAFNRSSQIMGFSLTGVTKM